MKSRKSIATKIMLAVTSVTMLAASCMFAACDGGNEGGGNTLDPTPTPTITDKNENIESVYGTYSHFLGYDALFAGLPSAFSTEATGDRNFYQYSTLKLIDGENGCKYILYRDLFQEKMEVHFWQSYVGTFTWEEGSRDVVLATPSEYSYFYHFGRVNELVAFDDRGATDIHVDLSQEAIDEGRTIELDDGNYTFPGEITFGQGTKASGLYGFNNEVCDYHNRGGKEEMTLTLDLNTMSFSYNFED